MHLQHAAGNAALARLLTRGYEREPTPSRPLLQRLVHQIGKDETSTRNAASLVTPEPGSEIDDTSLRPADRSSDQPFADLGPQEALHVVGHGDGEGHIEGMDADAFVAYLEKLGLTPSRHKGDIRLISCLSATKTKADRILAADILIVLRKHGFENQVISFDGLVRVLPGARIGTVAPASIANYDKAMGLLDKVMSEMQKIVGEQSAYALELLRVFEQTFPDNDFGEDFSGEENVEDLTPEEAAELAAALEGLPATAEDAQEEKETEERGESAPIPEATLETKPRRDDSPTGWSGAKVTGDPDERRRYNEDWERRNEVVKKNHEKVMAFTEKLFKAAQEHVNVSYDAK